MISCKPFKDMGHVQPFLPLFIDHIGTVEYWRQKEH